MPIDSIQPGEYLGRSIVDDKGTPMVTAGTRLTPKLIESVRARGYTSLYVETPGTEDIVLRDYLDPQLRQRITAGIAATFNDIQRQVAGQIDVREFSLETAETFRDRLQNPKFQKAIERVKIPMSFIKDINSMIDEIFSRFDFCETLSTMKVQDTFMMEHALEVTVNSLLMAKALLVNKREMTKIAFGCIMHDIGALLLDEDVRRGGIGLTPRQQEQYRLHTIFGYYLLKELKQVNLLSTHIAYQHHEFQDGTGFPRGIQGTNDIPTVKEAIAKGAGKVHRFASIVAVPNVFDRLCMARPVGGGMSQDQAVKIVAAMAGTRLNQEAVEAFLKITPVYPLGAVLLIGKGEFTGHRAVVARIDPEDLAQPTIRVLWNRRQDRMPMPVDIDLKKYDAPIEIRPLALSQSQAA